MKQGCAVVEYSNPNDAQRAIAELNDTDLLSRLIFVREDREINSGNVHHMPRGNAFAGGFPRGGYAAVRGGFPGAFAGGFAGGFDPYGFQQPFAHRGGFRGGYGGMPQVMMISSPSQAVFEIKRCDRCRLYRCHSALFCIGNAQLPRLSQNLDLKRGRS